MARPTASQRWILQAIQAWDRARLRRLQALHPGLEIHPSASTNLAHARFVLAPGARLRIGAGVRTERLHHGVRFYVREGSEVEIGAGTWLRSEVSPVHLVAEDGGRMTIGAKVFLNGCHLSAKERVEVADGAMIGPGTRVFDSDQHDLDEDRPERSAPVRIGELAWVAADVTVLRGVTIGAHSVIGSRSLVGDSIPDHTIAFGIPAAPRGQVGNRVSDFDRHPS